jgi:hypothetical protein
MDDDALRQLGDPATELRLDDLRETGWTVVGPAREKDNLTWVRISHRFASAEEANRLADQLGTPFRDLRLVRSRSFLKTKTSLTGQIDLSQGLAGFSDPALQEALGGADLGTLTDDNVHFAFDARLQGESRSWAPKLGEQVRISAEAEAWKVQPVLAVAAALVLAVTALVVVLAGRMK